MEYFWYGLCFIIWVDRNINHKTGGYTDYRIKSNSAAIAALITPAAGSAAILREALSAIAAEPDFNTKGMIPENRIIEIFWECIPEENTSEQWREYRLAADANRSKICCENMFCGCAIFIEYFFGNTQYLVSAGFQTLTGGGRVYYVTDSGVDTYRVLNVVEKIEASTP